MNFQLPAGVVPKTPRQFYTLHPTMFSRGNPIPNDRCLENARANVATRHRQVEGGKRKKRAPIIIVGGGPSLKRTLPELRRLQGLGFKVVAAGSVHDWLIDQGVIPWAATCVDPLPGMAEYYRHPHKKVRYLIASTCDPSVWRALKGYQRFLWHADVGVDLSWAKPKMLVFGGCTIVLRTINLMSGFGYRSYHLFGFDGCADPETDDEHAYPGGSDGELQNYTLGQNERTYRVPGSLILQFYDWDGFLAVHGKDLRFMVHGDGLMAALHRERALLGL